jgi:hypothetical protein
MKHRFNTDFNTVGSRDNREEVRNKIFRELMDEIALMPAVLGIDYGNVDGDHTVVAVRQGDSISHTWWGDAITDSDLPGLFAPALPALDLELPASTAKPAVKGITDVAPIGVFGGYGKRWGV